MDRVERGAAPGFGADHQTHGNERKHTLPDYIVQGKGHIKLNCGVGPRSGLSAQLQNRVKRVI